MGRSPRSEPCWGHYLLAHRSGKGEHSRSEAGKGARHGGSRAGRRQHTLAEAGDCSQTLKKPVRHQSSGSPSPSPCQWRTSQNQGEAQGLPVGLRSMGGQLCRTERAAGQLGKRFSGPRHGVRPQTLTGAQVPSLMPAAPPPFPLCCFSGLTGF